MTSPSRASRQPFAFTLIEVLVVVVLITVMAGMVIVNFSGSIQSRRADANAESLYGLLKFARMRAISTQSDHRVTFDETNHTFKIESLTTNDTGEQSWKEVKHFVMKRVVLAPGINVEVHEHLPIDTENDTLYEDGMEETLSQNDWTVVFKETGRSDHIRISLGVDQDGKLARGKTIGVHGYTGAVEITDGINVTLKTRRVDLDL
ncbi:hypothetical protein [Poriferisphaera sp. WC338]|uniref:hypothetical protein n=1 Tax=Poriferisphaera sp. WC338 TaxID=3425129 RepID=UPI003D8167B4